jgi:hypothetical protein
MAQQTAAKSTSPEWPSLHDVAERAGTHDVLLPYLQEGRIVARASEYLYWPSGEPMKLPPRSIPRAWWGEVRSIELATSRVCFVMDGVDVMAVGVELEPAAVEAALKPAVAVTSKPTKPEAKLKPKVWFDTARKKNPQRRGEGIPEYAVRLHNLMQTAPVAKLWTQKTLRRRLYDKE